MDGAEFFQTGWGCQHLQFHYMHALDETSIEYYFRTLCTIIDSSTIVNNLAKLEVVPRLTIEQPPVSSPTSDVQPQQSPCIGIYCENGGELIWQSDDIFSHLLYQYSGIVCVILRWVSEGRIYRGWLSHVFHRPRPYKTRNILPPSLKLGYSLEGCRTGLDPMLWSYCGSGGPNQPGLRPAEY